ncbi:MAG: helix-turn-helix domain-containing protein [Propionibacteriaceae bacterium]|jgi:transcriptional regulator with XRE-family HTH domain|nr:helix-turn-helix domain-containing protein [Propionibacteriaceae bacterium]
MVDINIGSSILHHRRRLELTQDDVANFLGVTKASVSKWETRASYPDIALLPRLATFFGVTIDELMGYDPQLSEAQIRALGRQYVAAFATRPFESVIDEIHEMIQRYYACYPFLLEMAVLLVNHANLAVEPAGDPGASSGGEDTEAAPPAGQRAVLEEVVALCSRVKAKTGDLVLARRANSIEAVAYLMLGRWSEVIDLLGRHAAQFETSDELLLSSAQSGLGDLGAARQTLQVASYQYVPRLVGVQAALLSLYRDDPEHFDAALERGLAVAQAYDLAHLHPNAFMQLTVSAAMSLAEQGQAERALGFLEQAVAAYDNFEFPLVVHGDTYFDLIDQWLTEADIWIEAPRDQTLVKQSFLELLTSPAFAGLADLVGYRDLVKHVRDS